MDKRLVREVKIDSRVRESPVILILQSWTVICSRLGSSCPQLKLAKPKNPKKYKHAYFILRMDLSFIVERDPLVCIVKTRLSGTASRLWH